MNDRKLDCLFCDIVAGRIPSKKVYEDAHLLAFRDVNPQAPVHILVIPRRHVAGIGSVGDEQALLAGQLLVAAASIARTEGLESDGYRLVINQGRLGGQTVGHLHVHLLGGRQLTWPPG